MFSSVNFSLGEMISSVKFEVFSGRNITESMIQEAARLFSESYGMWGPHAHASKQGDCQTDI